MIGTPASWSSGSSARRRGVDQVMILPSWDTRFDVLEEVGAESVPTSSRAYTLRLSYSDGEALPAEVSIEQASGCESCFQDLDFDPDALREKYRHERDKRLRDRRRRPVHRDGRRRSPTTPRTTRTSSRASQRDPITDEIDVAIIGGGFSGLLAAARLTEQGDHDFRIIEAGGDFGGTWYWNRYPGAQCDIESYCYLPLLEELGYMPKEKYSFVAEIFEHSPAHRRALRPLRATRCFQTRVRSMRLGRAIAALAASPPTATTTSRPASSSWRSGTANRPKLPGIPGIDDFEGHSFHTSRWDYDYTGGDTTGGMTKLADKRVAIIGTGATAIQCVPASRRSTPSTSTCSSARRRRSTCAATSRPIRSGVDVAEAGLAARSGGENFDAPSSPGQPVEEDLVDDGWTDIFRKHASRSPQGRRSSLGPREERSRGRRARRLPEDERDPPARRRASSSDPTTAEALKP